MSRCSRAPIALSWAAALVFAVSGQAQQTTSASPTQTSPATPTTTASAVTLPLAKIGDLSALLLDGGLLLHRLDGGSPAWLFIYGTHDGTSPSIHLSSFADGADTGYAIASLSAFYKFSDTDLKSLIAYADGADLSKSDGVWEGLSKSEAYSLAADPVLGDLGAKLASALIYFDATKSLTETTTSLVASGANLCGAVAPIAHEALRGTTAAALGGEVEGMVSAAQAVTTASISYNNTGFSAQASLYCAAGWPPPAGTTPAFPPASPGFTPPTGPVQWTGTGCGADEVGDSASCINPSGQLCTCTCTAHGLVLSGATWRPNPGSCAAIPVTPGPGAPGGPGACSPVGGSGPCSDASGATCVCPCVAGAGGGGVWGAPTSCPSGSAPLALLFGALALVAAWRQRH